MVTLVRFIWIFCIPLKKSDYLIGCDRNDCWWNEAFSLRCGTLSLSNSMTYTRFISYLSQWLHSYMRYVCGGSPNKRYIYRESPPRDVFFIYFDSFVGLFYGYLLHWQDFFVAIHMQILYETFAMTFQLRLFYSNLDDGKYLVHNTYT